MVSATAPVVAAEFFGAFWPDQYWEERLARAPFSTLNRVIVAFAPVIKLKDGHYSIDFQEPASSVERVNKLLGRVRQINPTAQLHVSVCANENDPSSFLNAAKDKNFALNAVVLMERFGFSGLDFDWEAGIERDPLNHLATHLSDELKPKGYALTMDGWSYAGGNFHDKKTMQDMYGKIGLQGMYDMQVLKNCLNFNAMTYGRNCPYQQCIQSYTDLGFPINQINIGIESEFTWEGGNEMDTPGPGGSIEAKDQFALKCGMGGGFNWRKDNDDCCISGKPYHPTFQCGAQQWSTLTGTVLPKDQDGRFIIPTLPPLQSSSSRFCLLV